MWDIAILKNRKKKQTILENGKEKKTILKNKKKNEIDMWDKPLWNTPTKFQGPQLSMTDQLQRSCQPLYASVNFVIASMVRTKSRKHETRFG